jgi:hypothetical protein
VWTDFIGLAIVVAAFGALLYVWLGSLKSKIRTNADLVGDQPDDASTLAGEGSEAPSWNRSFTLAPARRDDAAFPQMGVEDSVVEVATNDALALPSSVAPPCPAATTHLEIAAIQYDMGDFEGATELAALVLSNPKAVTAQVEKAQSIIERCS